MIDQAQAIGRYLDGFYNPSGAIQHGCRMRTAN